MSSFAAGTLSLLSLTLFSIHIYKTEQTIQKLHEKSYSILCSHLRCSLNPKPYVKGQANCFLFTYAHTLTYISMYTYIFPKAFLRYWIAFRISMFIVIYKRIQYIYLLKLISFNFHSYRIHSTCIHIFICT